jgi:nucleotide-binding universal stress UspA family protein
MFAAERILLASHGTPGARAAERAAIDMAASAATIFHLVVIPDFWKGMMGDDWLNNASTRATYGRHVESQLAREIEENRHVLEQEVVACGRHYEFRVALGKPDQVLLEYAAEVRPDLVVIGSPRPRGVPGLRSSMRIATLAGALDAAIVVIPRSR